MVTQPLTTPEQGGKPRLCPSPLHLNWSTDGNAGSAILIAIVRSFLPNSSGNQMLRSAHAFALALTIMVAACSKNTAAIVPRAAAAEQASGAVPLAMLPRDLLPE